MVKILLILSVLSFSSLPVWAGGSIAGNGGDGVFCPNSPPQPVLQLLDFFEMKFFDNQIPDFMLNVPGTAEQKVAAVIVQFEKISSLRAARYRDELNHFAQRISFVDSDLPYIPDDLNIVLPVGCSIRQIVIQTRQGGIPSYQVNRSLWNALDVNQRAGLMLHEIVYGENIDGGHSDSRSTRAFVALLSAGLPRWIDQSIFNYDVRKLGIYTYLQTDYSSGDFSLGQCGYGIKGMPPVIFTNLCRPDVRGLVIQVDGSIRIKKVLGPDGALLYKISASELGLPFEVDDYQLVDNNGDQIKQWLIPLSPVTFADHNARLVCLAGKKVTLQPTLANPNRERFDLAHVLIDECLLDPKQSPANEVFLDDSWREVISFSQWFENPIEGTGRSGRFQFANREGFEFRGQWIQAKSVNINQDVVVDLYDVVTFHYQGPKASCEVEGDIEADASIGYNALKFTKLAKPCGFNVEGRRLLFSGVTLGPQDEFWGGSFSEDTKFPIFVSADPIKKRIRPLPAGVEIELVDKYHPADGFSVKPARVELGDKIAEIQMVDGSVANIKSYFQIGPVGTLVEGILAKDTTVLVEDYYEGPEQKKLLKAGTTIELRGDAYVFYHLP